MRLKRILVVFVIIIILNITPTEAHPPKVESYRSPQFGFQISYPNSWQQRKPAPGAVFTIFRQNQTAGISVNVANLTGDKTTVMRQMETKDFRDSMLSGVKQRFPDAILLQYNKTSLGASSANLYVIQYTMKTVDSSSEIVSAQILSIYRKSIFRPGGKEARCDLTHLG
jgi:hypothetical protein